jgi:5-methyltetrahydrofolate--homocysteine methyltransferase
MHTAVKISPAYSGPVVYVLDASRSVPVCQTLLDIKNKELFVEDIKEQYQEMRDEFYAGLEDRKYLPLPDCQRKALTVILAFFHDYTAYEWMSYSALVQCSAWAACSL